MILFIFALPALSPPSPDNPSEALLPGAPETAQAFIPMSDISQIFGHLAKFAQGVEKISQVREEFNMVRDNFKKINQIAGSAFGVNLGLEKFLAPFDKFMKNTFDPILGLTKLTTNELLKMREDYTNMNSGKNQGRSLSEQGQMAGEWTLSLMKEMVTDPGKANDRLQMINNTVRKVNECVTEHAKGSQSFKQCQSMLEQAGLRQMGQIERAITRQTMLLASQGMDSRAAKRQREALMEVLMNNARQETLNADFNEHRNTLR
jgi:hypothetical protein